MNTGYILYRAVSLFFNIYYLLILANVVFSWVRPIRGTFLYDLSRIVYQLTEPVLSPIRRALPMMGGLDFSPFIALILLQLIQRLVTGLLF
ncbi:MAG: YggT family protein [Symbiobacteriia bacterium]